MPEGVAGSSAAGQHPGVRRLARERHLATEAGHPEPGAPRRVGHAATCRQPGGECLEDGEVYDLMTRGRATPGSLGATRLDSRLDSEAFIYRDVDVDVAPRAACVVRLEKRCQ